MIGKFIKIRVQSGKHTSNPLVLWLGILTALLLIFGIFFNSSYPLVDIELGFLEQLSMEKIKAVTAMVRDSLQWLKI